MESLEGQEYGVMGEEVEQKMKVSPEFQGNCWEIGWKIVLLFVIVVVLLQIVIDLKQR